MSRCPVTICTREEARAGEYIPCGKPTTTEVHSPGLASFDACDACAAKFETDDERRERLDDEAIDRDIDASVEERSFVR